MPWLAQTPVQWNDVDATFSAEVVTLSYLAQKAISHDGMSIGAFRTRGSRRYGSTWFQNYNGLPGSALLVETPRRYTFHGAGFASCAPNGGQR